ncbi:DUF58 domain-containing protein [Algihabitans albus]|uniref:DUF58 domain-containing protein n=1 Tax=Algihabitans albus TaxID=2164067 RepID=UPI000E5D337F|nr:hypothetical protein [Algihabitans albus]
MTTAAEFALFDAIAYQLRARFAGGRPGAHRGRQRGAGARFADTAPLLTHPDPRRIDLRRSLRDPFGTIHVRRFEVPAAVTVHALMDFSASLAVAGAGDRWALAALLGGAVAQGAVRTGDRFALAAARGGDLPPLLRPPLRYSGLGVETRALLDTLEPSGQGIETLTELAAEIPARRTLTFLISDFEMPPEMLSRLLTLLDGHALWPIWLRDSGLDDVSGRFGLCDILDPETGAARTLLMRPGYARAYARRRAECRAATAEVFAAFGRRPIEVVDRIDTEAFVAALATEPA